MSKQQEKRDQAARAAWLYYVGNHTQQDIAEQLGVSRQIAQRLIAYAVEHGLVKVRVTHPVSACLELAESLRSRFRLEACHVVPTLSLIHISEPTRQPATSRMPSSA